MTAEFNSLSYRRLERRAAAPRRCTEWHAATAWGLGIAASLSLGQFPDDAFCGREHLVDFLGLLAAGFGEIGPSAAAAADDRPDILDDLAVSGVLLREDDDAALDPPFQRVGEIAQRVFVEVGHAPPRQLHAADID